MDEVAVGQILGVFGLRGELKCDPTRAGRTLFSPGAVFRCVGDETPATVHVTQVRPHKGRLLIHLEGVEDATVAGAYAGATLFAPRRDVRLDEGEYLDADLVGCAVVGADGTPYGTVESVAHYPSSDMLMVAGRLVPMVAAIVAQIDIEGRRIVIDPPAGLFD